MLFLFAFPSSPKYLIYCSDEEEKLWVWSYQDTEMFMDLEEEVCSYYVFCNRYILKVLERAMKFSQLFFLCKFSMWI